MEKLTNGALVPPPHPPTQAVAAIKFVHVIDGQAIHNVSHGGK